jgi:hypothetical protein
MHLQFFSVNACLTHQRRAQVGEDGRWQNFIAPSCHLTDSQGELQLKQARVEAAEMAARRQEQEQMRVIAEQRRLLEETKKRVLQEAEREEQERLARVALDK